MLTRAQFESACQAFSRRHSQWSWVAGHRPGYGYLTRATSHSGESQGDFEVDELASDPELEADDRATAPCAPPALNVQEYIVYSASFNVPAFYFTMHDSNGTPLPLSSIVQTSFFKYRPPNESKATDFALSLPSASFPLLSQGDHPTLGTPCWYFHPCSTDNAVGEFMTEVEQPGWTEETRLVRWMELWIMVVGSILNL